MCVYAYIPAAAASARDPALHGEIPTSSSPALLGRTGSRLAASPSLAFTRDCHDRYCMVYSIQKGRRERGVPCAVVVQCYRNSAGITGGGGNAIMIGSLIKTLK